MDFGLPPVRAMLAERLALYPVDTPASFIFTNETGKPRDHVPRRYARIIGELGFNDTPRRKGNSREHIDFHALRHTYATHQIVYGGVDQIKLKELMGHQRLEMTLRYVEIADHIKAQDSRKILNSYDLPQEALEKPVKIHAILTK